MYYLPYGIENMGIKQLYGRSGQRSNSNRRLITVVCGPVIGNDSGRSPQVLSAFSWLHSSGRTPVYVARMSHCFSRVSRKILRAVIREQCSVLTTLILCKTAKQIRLPKFQLSTVYIVYKSAERINFYGRVWLWDCQLSFRYQNMCYIFNCCVVIDEVGIGLIESDEKFSFTNKHNL